MWATSRSLADKDFFEWWKWQGGSERGVSATHLSEELFHLPGHAWHVVHPLQCPDRPAVMNETHPISPLTVIAIFAGIIEASALASLPFLSERSQTIYTWFLVGFPFFLTLLFFLTLNFNYRSLYSPTIQASRLSAAERSEGDVPRSQTRVLERRSSLPTDADTHTLVVSGPEARRTVEQHLTQVVNATPPVHCHWIIYDRERSLCVRLTVEPLSTAQPPLARAT